MPEDHVLSAVQDTALSILRDVLPPGASRRRHLIELCTLSESVDVTQARLQGCIVQNDIFNSDEQPRQLIVRRADDGTVQCEFQIRKEACVSFSTNERPTSTSACNLRVRRRRRSQSMK